MKRPIQGDYVLSSTAGACIKAYVPKNLPPSPEIEWTEELSRAFSEASRALGELNGTIESLPDANLFLYTYIRQEAVLSSKIEGTQSSLSDLLYYENNLIKNTKSSVYFDAEEVSNYVKAINYGIYKLSEMPLCLRLIREIHEILLSCGRGSQKNPGSFRESQNWVGGLTPQKATYIPPPPHLMKECLFSLEKFINSDNIDSLVKAALVHVQFETIHPFLDGNGRIGRMLIPLILYSEKILAKPILYISLYFKLHRLTYYDLLNKVRLDGDWESWLLFFANAVIDASCDAIEKIKKIYKIKEDDTKTIETFGRSSKSTLKIYEEIIKNPIFTAATLREKTLISLATINKSLSLLKNSKIITQINGLKRNRIFLYKKYIDEYNE